MNTAAAVDTSDPRQKKKLIQGVLFWIACWIVAIVLVPVVNATDWSTAIKGTLNTILLVGVPKVGLLVAIGIMGKPGFAFLKSMVKSKLSPPATVGPVRYKLGLALFVTVIVLGMMGPYIAMELTPFRQANPRLVAGAGDALLLISLFILGGDFWDKLRSLFIREAKVVFPAK